MTSSVMPPPPASAGTPPPAGGPSRSRTCVRIHGVHAAPVRGPFPQENSADPGAPPVTGSRILVTCSLQGFEDRPFYMHWTVSRTRRFNTCQVPSGYSIRKDCGKGCGGTFPRHRGSLPLPKNVTFRLNPAPFIEIEEIKDWMCCDPIVRTPADKLRVFTPDETLN